MKDRRRNIRHRRFDLKRDGGLTDFVNRLLDHGLAAGTRKKYRQHVRSYERLVINNGIGDATWATLPSEIDLIFYVAFRAKKGIAPGAIKSELSAIVEQCVALGLGNPTIDVNGAYLPRLKRVVRGISRKCSRQKRQRLPLTTDKLNELIPWLRAVVGNRVDAACIEACLDLGVYGLLRIGEMTAPTTTSRKATKHLNVGDVEFIPSWENPVFMDLNIKVSKPDIYRRGQRIRIAANHGPSCPVQAMKRWLTIRGREDKDGALFKMRGGRYLTRNILQRQLRAALTKAGHPGHAYSTHSLRSGGATSLICAGFDGALVQIFGRWASDCHLQYMRMTDATKVTASRAISKLSRQDFDAAGKRGHKFDAEGQWM